MDFGKVFIGMGVVLVAIIGIFGLTGSWNQAYGTDIGEDPEFTATRERVESLIEKNLVDEGLAYGQSTEQQEGAGQSSDQGSNLVTRALRTVSLLPQLIGLAPALMKDAAIALNIPEIYWRLGQALFWILFGIAFASFLLMGARGWIGR